MDIVCPYRWNYVVINLQQQKTNTCCKTSLNKINLKFSDAFLNNKTQFQRRREMLDGIKHKACSQCWQLERIGGISWRLAANKNREEIASRQGVISNYIDCLELTLGNTCDMKCVYCNKEFSTQWAVEDFENGRINKKEYKEFVKDLEPNLMKYFWNWFDDNKKIIKNIQIKGGEPLIMPEFYKLIDKLVDTNINLHVVTNLNTQFRQFDIFLEKIKLITQDKQFNVLISMDSIGEHAEYIRNGLSWTRFDKNLNKLYELSYSNNNLNIGFIITMTVLNIKTHIDFLRYMFSLYKTHQKNILINFNYVNWPKELNPYKANSNLSIYLDDSINYINECLENIKDESMAFSWKKYNEYIINLKGIIGNNKKSFEPDRIIQIDQTRNLNHKILFPELYGNRLDNKINQ